MEFNKFKQVWVRIFLLYLVTAVLPFSRILLAIIIVTPPFTAFPWLSLLGRIWKISRWLLILAHFNNLFIYIPQFRVPDAEKSCETGRLKTLLDHNHRNVRVPLARIRLQVVFCSHQGRFPFSLKSEFSPSFIKMGHCSFLPDWSHCPTRQTTSRQCPSAWHPPWPNQPG